MITNILLGCYPFIIFLSLHYDRINLAILFLVIIFILRLFTQTATMSQIRWLAKLTPCLGLFLAVISWLLSKHQLLLYYPVAVNLTLFLLFSHSLKTPPTIIERFARMRHGELSERTILYTRKETYCWCLFFIFNGTIALITCLSGNIEWWTFYNGGISYLFIAMLMGGGWLIRKKYQY